MAKTKTPEPPELPESVRHELEQVRNKLSWDITKAEQDLRESLNQVERQQESINKARKRLADLVSIVGELPPVNIPSTTSVTMTPITTWVTNPLVLGSDI